MPLVLRGDISALRLVEALSTSPAKVARIEGGTLAVGSRADFVLLDPTTTWTVAARLCSKSHNTPLLHQEVTGQVRMTVAAGDILPRSLLGRR